MYHLKLVKGISYSNGIISATKKQPDVLTNDKTVADTAVKSGYFILARETIDKANFDNSQLENMKLEDLKNLAADIGIDTSGLKKKSDFPPAFCFFYCTIFAAQLEDLISVFLKSNKKSAVPI